jgi:hypothetical protein
MKKEVHMGTGEMIIARFRDGRVVKGYVRDFRIDADAIAMSDHKTEDEHTIPFDALKGVFFVKNFKGSSFYDEKKIYGIGENIGTKVYVKFRDNEGLVGFIEGDVPWDRGFSLAKLGEKAKGFFMTPVDNKSNNNKVFVVGSAIQDITIVVP